MKKTIIFAVSFFIFGAILSPFAGMALNSTRKLILGLAPDSAILKLADEIDKSREENIQKIVELQEKLNQQEQSIKEQQGIVDSQNNYQNQTADQASAISEELKNQQNCNRASELYTSIPKKPSGAFSIVGPNNIVDMYKEVKKSYESSNDDTAKKSFKKYLDVLEPAYQEYLTAKDACK